MKIAYRIYPLPNGTINAEDDMQTVDDVVRLFDYCQILEANITKEGWEYLIGKFGMNGLYEADMRSEWFGCDGIEEFAAIMECLRKMPERSDRITAYGAGPDPEEDEDIDALGDFAEAILEDESLKSLQDDTVNVYYQLFSIDFQRCYEGIATFYENFYKDNTKENVLRATKWLKQNRHEQMAIMIDAGYDSEEKQKVTAQWIDAHTGEIYGTYRTLMFLFEDKYLGGGEYVGIQTDDNL